MLLFFENVGTEKLENVKVCCWKFLVNFFSCVMFVKCIVTGTWVLKKCQNVLLFYVEWKLNALKYPVKFKIK